MAVVGLGIDSAQISRFQRFVTERKETLLEHLFTVGERDYAAGHGAQASHLAACFAAKESFCKALGTGLRGGLSWLDMEVVHDALGKPELQLAGRAAAIFQERGLSTLHLSLSHDGDYALAVVVVERL